MTLPTPRNKEEALFLSHVKEVPPPTGKNLTSPCWEWTASCAGDGRPQFNRHINKRQKNNNAARWAFNHFKETLLPGEHACHLCDNELCVSPEHIVPGSNNDNVQDRVAKSEYARNKLNNAVELSNKGAMEDDIAITLKITLCEVERLLDFNADDESIYEAEKQSLGIEAANINRLLRLRSDYYAVNGAKESLSLDRHIQPSGLNG
ncbi:hypothetical protein AD953_05015 [Acetobacter malorum]|uniref:HNH nuclease domain-containing protein n=1 Tax=Acetobacter malorum TaxID=178901 RepID=A0A149V9P2_9PROT|nr:hypothetical protein [Acetobacter malorum]KXV76939.1 hypothetical protein AD953_05015 [Acetobacter malorum]